MRRIVMVSAVVIATFATVGLSGQASAEPGSHGASNGSSQVREPSGQLTRPVAGPTGSRQQPADARTAAATPAAAGTGCTYRDVSQYYCRAGAYQKLTADGAVMSVPVQSPLVDSADYHSLTEMAVESGDGKQIIEIGWRVYRLQDQTPRLFIFHWVDGQPTCYNTENGGCGFVSTSSTITPGMALSPSSTPVQFQVEYSQGNWWYGYNGTWFGYLPDSIWGGRYTNTHLVQYFGEVSSTTPSPCTYMGNGYMGTSAYSAEVTGIAYYNPTATVTNLTTFTPDDSTLYDSQTSSADSFRYGGSGVC